MLADLVKIQERILETFDKSGHATKRSPLELLALEQGLAVLEKTDIVSGNGLDQVLGRGELAESNAEVVGIVESVEKILVERMNVLQPWEALEDGAEFFGECFLGKLDLAGVKSWFISVRKKSKKSRQRLQTAGNVSHLEFC
jgi:hypothetical protein